MSTTTIPFIWTNDDLGVTGYQEIEPLRALLDRHGIKGTFFVVPCPNGQHFMTDDAKFIDSLKSMQREGHEFQQHSTTHVCIENGTADLRMFDLMGDDEKVQYSQQRFLYEKLWQLEALEAQIGWGRKVWIDAMGETPTGFRSGCGAFCGNMYHALENLGFDWCSSRLTSMTGWMWAAGKFDYPLRLEGPIGPFRQGSLIEFPILDDVAFHIPRVRIDDFVELGWRLWKECLRLEVPYMLVSHPTGLRHEDGGGYEVHEKLLARILDSGQADPMTLSEYFQKLQKKKLPLFEASPEYLGTADFPDWHALSTHSSRHISGK